MRMFFMAAAMAASISPALALTDTDQQFVKRMTEAYIAADKCPWLAADPRRMDLLVIAQTGDLGSFGNGSEWERELRTQMPSISKRLSSLSADGVCAMGQQLFGAQGEVFPGLLVAE